jgi:predicted dehydrogenase
MEPLNICIVGAGRMGRLRAGSALKHPQCKVAYVVDANAAAAEDLAAQAGCLWSTDWAAAVSRPEIDAVVVSTSHKYLAPIARKAVEAGKHVFCEKPMGRNAGEAAAVVEAVRAARQHRPQLNFTVGFTLRHHPAVTRAYRMVQAGAIGQPFYVRAFYGHGGRPGYDQEWRMDPEVGGGGELLDQGVHLIDLSCWFLGDFTAVTGGIGNYFWTGSAYTDDPVKTAFPTHPGPPVEDNAFLVLRTAMGQSALLHASWTQWKNAFQFEIFGHDGSLTVHGLGGSYGAERLVHARRKSEGGAPELAEFTFDGGASVWDAEWGAFVAKIGADVCQGEEFAEPATDVAGWKVLQVVDRVYASARQPAAVNT